MLASVRSISSSSRSGSTRRRKTTLADLLSLLRKNSMTMSASVAAPSAYSLILQCEMDENEKRETDAFLQEGEEDENKPMSRQKILEKIRQKKEIIGKLRCQPWSMRRKRRTLRLAQKYLERHEAKVSKTHLYKEELSRQWKKFRRWLDNMSIYLIPWEAKIKNIESHFGSVVSSYFVFLRWIFWVNFMITLIVTVFIVLPECLADVSAGEERLNETGYIKRKELNDKERPYADHIQTVWDFKGYFRTSPFFYGFYSSDEFVGETIQYRVPLAYFLVIMFILGYSFFAILRKMAANARMSKLASGKAEQYTFNWKVFTGWDYTIGNPETAANTVMANVNKLREAISDYRVKLHRKFVCSRFLLRMLAWIIILGMLALSTFLIAWAVERSKTTKDSDSALRKNEVPIIVSLITLIFPSLMELVGMIERYHPRNAMRWQLFRVYVLYILNYYTLIIALFTKMEYYKDLQANKIIQAQIRASNLNQGSQIPVNNMPDSESERSRRDIEMDWLSKRVTTPPPHSNISNIPSQLSNDTLLWEIEQFDANRTLPPLIRLLTKGKSLSRTTRQLIIDGQGANGTNKYYEYTTQEPPWTTIVPEHGPVGVDKAKAFYKENATDEDKGSPTLETFPIPPDPGPDIIGGVSVGDREFQTAPTDEDLENLCWETMVGQEISVLITTDLVMTIASILLVDFFRALWVRYCNEWWCWDLERTFPEYGEFKVAENVLHIINNQGMIWLGLFFAPLLPALNNVKLIILMYVRAWACTCCNVPATQIFRASRSSNFYLMMLLVMLFLCTLPVGYVIASREPSDACGPFSGKNKFYEVITDVFQKNLHPDHLQKLEYVASPGVIVPLLLLLILVIYFLISLVRGLREANQDLQKQLLHERTEEKKKIFHMAGAAQKKKSGHPPLSGAPSMPESKKIDMSHLPVNEQKRRDPWRNKKRLDIKDRAPEGITDEESSDDDGSTPRRPVSPNPLPPTPPDAAINLKVPSPPGVHYRPSLGSLREEGDTPVSSEADDLSSGKNRKSKEKKSRSPEELDIPSIEMSASSSATASTIEEIKLDVEDGIDEILPEPEPLETPDEIREIIRSEQPLNHLPYGAEGFPSPTNEIFEEPEDILMTPRSEPSSYDNNFQSPRSPISETVSAQVSPEEVRNQLNGKRSPSPQKVKKADVQLDELHQVLVHPYASSAGYHPLLPMTDETDNTTETPLTTDAHETTQDEADSASDLEKFAKHRAAHPYQPLTPATLILSESDDNVNEQYLDTEPIIKPSQSKPINSEPPPEPEPVSEPEPETSRPRPPFLSSSPLSSGFVPWPSMDEVPKAPPRPSRAPRREPRRLNGSQYPPSPASSLERSIQPNDDIKFADQEMPSTSTPSQHISPKRPKFKIALSPSRARDSSEEGDSPRRKFVIRQAPADLRTLGSAGLPVTLSMVNETAGTTPFRTMSKKESDV